MLLICPQDGTISYEIKLTGELSTNQLSEGEGPKPAHGTLVAPGVNAQHHQHMFCARLDLAVDDEEGGKGLVVSEVCGCYSNRVLYCNHSLGGAQAVAGCHPLMWLDVLKQKHLVQCLRNCAMLLCACISY